MTHLESDLAEERRTARERLLSNARWELAPVKNPAKAAADLPPGAQVTMSCFASSEGFDTTIALVQALTAQGHSVTPHLPARSIRGPGHLAELLARLGEMGVHDVFVVAGNTRKPAGPYDGAVDVLPDAAAADFRIGVAAHPEGHPHLSAVQATNLLRRKQEFASYLVTQTCFDHHTVIDWLRSIRAEGVHLPAQIGVAGVVSRTELLRMAAWMGVGKSMKFINKQRKLAARLVGPSAYDPTPLLHGLVDAAASTELGIAGVHLNTFNQVASTRAWWDGVQA